MRLCSLCRQGEDRAHRYGQTKQVHIYRLITKGTVEETKYQRAEFKLKLHQRILQEDGEELIVLGSGTCDKPLSEKDMDVLNDELYGTFLICG